MVSTISPVVYRSSGLRHNAWVLAAVSYTMGSIVGGVLAGVFFGLSGVLLVPSLGTYQSLLPLVVGVLAIAYAMHELHLVSLPYPQRKRQVPSQWRHAFHPYFTAGIFGLLLGTGFITFIPTATYYIVSLAVILHNSPILGVLVFATYGASRAFLFWTFSWQNRAPDEIERLSYYMDLTKPIVRQINGFALAMTCSYLFSVYI